MAATEDTHGCVGLHNRQTSSASAIATLLRARLYSNTTRRHIQDVESGSSYRHDAIKRVFQCDREIVRFKILIRSLLPPDCQSSPGLALSQRTLHTIHQTYSAHTPCYNITFFRQALENRVNLVLRSFYGQPALTSRASCLLLRRSHL